MTEAEALKIARQAAVDFIETHHNRIMSVDPNDRWGENSIEACRDQIIKAGMLLASLCGSGNIRKTVSENLSSLLSGEQL